MKRVGLSLVVKFYLMLGPDMGAYLAAGIPASQIFIIGKHAGEQGTQTIRS